MPTVELTKTSLIIRLAIIGVILAAIIGSFAYAGGWLTPHRLSPRSMINTFDQVDGPHPVFAATTPKVFAASSEQNDRLEAYPTLLSAASREIPTPEFCILNSVFFLNCPCLLAEQGALSHGPTI